MPANRNAAVTAFRWLFDEPSSCYGRVTGQIWMEPPSTAPRRLFKLVAVA
jgi:hypothetical protein